MSSKRSNKDAAAGAGGELLELMRLVAAGNNARVMQMLKKAPALATAGLVVGASASTEGYFFTEIMHYVYAGDTLLHIASASFKRGLAEHLIGLGADHSLKNRRGAEPLHYACDTNRDEPEPQAETITYLCAAGANLNALDMSGVAPIHRAVRTRGAAAVAALLTCGADPRLKNKSGSTPLHLAVQNTGRGGTGTPAAIERQEEIIALLLEHGAVLTDKDARGRTAADAAHPEAIRSVLEKYASS